MSGVDKSKIKPVPIEKTLTLVNNFLVTTSVFLNSFSENVEKKIAKISHKLTEMEVLLAVFEAKLNSVPMLEEVQPPPGVGSSSSQTTGAQPSAAASSSSSSQPGSGVPPPPPPPLSGSTEITPASAESTWGEEYKSFEKMLKVGVPFMVVQQKAVAAGLDGAVIERIAASF
eukprot:gene6224-6859_t